jgi:hypothetical protein
VRLRKTSNADERIVQQRNAIAAKGFVFLSWGILLITLYRQFVRHQAVSEYGDYFLLFVAVSAYVVLSNFGHGSMGRADMGRILKLQVPVIVITIVVVSYFRGLLDSPLSALVVGFWAAVGALVCVPVCYGLYARWVRRNNLEDQ